MSLYYGIWATMIQWPVILRAAVVMGVCFLVFWLFMPLIFLAASWVLKGFDLILKFIYTILCFAIQLLYHLGLNRLVVAVTNRLSSVMQILSSVILQAAEGLRRGKRPGKRTCLLIYGILLALIALPDLLGGVISKPYRKTVGFAQNIYLDLEKDTVEKAKEYDPIIKKKKSRKDRKEKAAEKETEKGEVWLSLTGEGVSGANIRSGNGKNYESVDIVRGEDRLLYLGKEGEWIHVRTEEGVEGWISEKIVTGVPGQP